MHFAECLVKGGELQQEQKAVFSQRTVIPSQHAVSLCALIVLSAPA